MASSIASRVRARHAAKNHTNLHVLADAAAHVSRDDTPSYSNFLSSLFRSVCSAFSSSLVSTLPNLRFA